jgi:hypothetical protein
MERDLFGVVWWWVYGLYPPSEEQNIKNIKKLKLQRFGSWLCFRPQVNGGGEDKNIYSKGPNRVDVLLFSTSIHLKTEAESASETLWF